MDAGTSSRRTARAVAARRGSATVFAAIALVMIVGLAAVILSVSYRHSGEASADVQANRAFFVAQAGVNQALNQLVAGAGAAIGSPDERVESPGGSYWVDFADNGDATRTLTAHGRAGLRERAIEVVVVVSGAGIYAHGLFAGNSSGAAGYTLELGGSGSQADSVLGDVYSGGDVDVAGDASVSGRIRAVGSASGNGADEAETGKRQPLPDIAGMSYEATAEIQVAAEFASGEERYERNDAGGSAWQLPEANPAHIFRKNPDDRSDETSSTFKDDYFLEDPYEDVSLDPRRDGSSPTGISLSGVGGEPGPSTNQKVFFVDGNLWIHNYKTFSFSLEHGEPNGVQITFVVKGNVYISDSFFYEDPRKDGVAFIAMKDPGVADSGNVYLGDPEFGTLKSMSAFLFAEEDFYDYNLDEDGSASVELYGNMTAGDHVLIERDYEVGNGPPQHSKLTIDFDERVASGELTLPGLPRSSGGNGEDYSILSWREVSAQ